MKTRKVMDWLGLSNFNKGKTWRKNEIENTRHQLGKALNKSSDDEVDYVVVPDEEIDDSDALIVVPDEEIEDSDALIVVPDEEIEDSDVPIVVPDEEIDDSDALIVVPDEEIEDSDVPIVVPDEEIEDGEINDGSNSNVMSLYDEIDESELKNFRNLSKGYNEKEYLKAFGKPKNIISFGNGEKLYVSDCLVFGTRKYLIGYVKKGNQVKLRLFYRSRSEGSWRSCPGAREKKKGEFIGYSKGTKILKSSYETTTRVPNEIECKFDTLPEDNISIDPVYSLAETCGYRILEKEMDGEISIDKLFKKYPDDTCLSFVGNKSSDVIKMYKHLGENFNLNGMKLLEGRGYTYEHQFLGTIEVQVCRLNYKGQDIDFHFAWAKGDSLNRVRIEQLTYADAKINSFGVYDRQINASPLSGKPIEYVSVVPYDMRNNKKFYGSNYIDVRNLYQENPIIKWFKRNIQ